MSNEIEFMTIKNIEGKDVTFIRVLDSVCAFARFDKLPERTVCGETYREGEVVGVDTMHPQNKKQTFEEKTKAAEYQISEIIKAIKEIK